MQTRRVIEVVIVDDDHDTAGSMCDAFGALGWRARGFERADVAWSAMREEPPDLLVVTIGAGRERALELAFRVRSSRRMQGVAVIALTSCRLSPNNPLFHELLTIPTGELDTRALARRLVAETRASKTVTRRLCA